MSNHVIATIRQGEKYQFHDFFSFDSAFRKVVQATMLRDRQHGPVIELNRISVKKSSQKAPPPTGTSAAGATAITSAGPGGTGNGCKPVFQQMVVKMHLLGQEALLLPHRVWKVKFIGERYKNLKSIF